MKDTGRRRHLIVMRLRCEDKQINGSWIDLLHFEKALCRLKPEVGGRHICWGNSSLAHAGHLRNGKHRALAEPRDEVKIGESSPRDAVVDRCDSGRHASLVGGGSWTDGYPLGQSHC